jgi:uncharacterized protein (TIGR02217 family)
MAIIVLSDVLLPNSIISAGIRGKNMRMNSRVETDSGQRTINVVWTKTLRQYELGTVPLTLEQWQAIETLHEVTEGGAYGFLMEDPKDNTVTNGVMTRTAAGLFQLVKRYTETLSGRTKDRNITRPRSTGLVISQSGTPLSSGSYTVNYNTGVVTIASNPDPATLSWSGKFYVPVHFMDDFIDWDLVAPGSPNQRFLSGPSVVLQEIRE